MSAESRLANPAARAFAQPWSVRLLLPLLAIALAAFLACGTDDGTSDPAAAPVAVDGDTFTWSPPWKAGDTRMISSSVSVDYGPGILAMMSLMQSDGDSSDTDLFSMLEQEPFNVGSVSVISGDAGGAVAKFDFAFEELLGSVMRSDEFDSSSVDQSQAEFLSILSGLASSIDLGLKFDLEASGAHSEVKNLEELASEASQLFDSLKSLAALGGEELMDADDIARAEALLDEIPSTQAARFVANAMLNSAVANMFLMRTGSYTVGQPVIMTGSVPSASGIVTNGLATYRLDELSETITKVSVDVTPGSLDLLPLAVGVSWSASSKKVDVTPGSLDLLPLLEQYATEVAGIVSNNPEVYVAGVFDHIENNLPVAADELLGLLFSPYTVTLTIDSSTGWVTAADWSLDITIPPALLETDGDVELPQGIDPSLFTVTINVKSTFS